MIIIVIIIAVIVLIITIVIIHNIADTWHWVFSSCKNSTDLSLCREQINRAKAPKSELLCLKGLSLELYWKQRSIYDTHGAIASTLSHENINDNCDRCIEVEISLYEKLHNTSFRTYDRKVSINLDYVRDKRYSFTPLSKRDAKTIMFNSLYQPVIWACNSLGPDGDTNNFAHHRLPEAIWTHL